MFLSFCYFIIKQHFFINFVNLFLLARWMSPQIAAVLQIQIPPAVEKITSKFVNTPIQQRAIKGKQHQRQHISYLLQQISQYRQKITSLKQVHQINQQNQPLVDIKSCCKLSNEQVSIVNQKQIQQQIKKDNVEREENIKNDDKQNDELLGKDHFQYQIEMLRQQNNLLKQQNLLLKQQQTIKLKINKTDQLIINHQHSNLIIPTNTLTYQSQQHLHSLPQVDTFTNIPILIQDCESQNLNNNQHEIQPEHKNFVRSTNNIRPISSGASLRIRPQSFKKRETGKIISIKAKHSNEKSHVGTQDLSSPLYSSRNQQRERLLDSVTQQKRETESEIDIKSKQQSSKGVISTQPKVNTAVTAVIKQKPKTINNRSKSKQRLLIKQEAFNKISVTKHTLSERKLSKAKEKQLFNLLPIDSKIKSPLQIKLHPNTQKIRPSHNEKKHQNKAQQLPIGKSLEFLEFNTVIQKIDLENISSLNSTDKKTPLDKKAQISFQNINVSQLESFQDFLKLVPKFPLLPNPPLFQNTQQEFLKLAKQTFPLFNVHSLQSSETDLNVKKFKNCVYFGIDPYHNILWHYDGKIYFGSWKLNEEGQGQKSGQGIQFYPKKFIFSGQFSQGKKNGQGILHLLNTTNQSIYIGQFVNGKKQGRGKIIDQAGNIYEGEWYDDKRHGFGLYKYCNGDFYEGTFIRGLKQGFGVEKFANGDLYRGQYNHDRFQGKGHYIWRNSSYYDGEFHQGKRNGTGIWKSSNLPDAQIYQGQYMNDKRNGYGIYRWHNGSYYQGSFKEDKKHGVGKTRYENGKVAVLQWVEGQCVGRVERGEWPQFAAIERNDQSTGHGQLPLQKDNKFVTTNKARQIYLSEEQMGQISRSRQQTQQQSYKSQEAQLHQQQPLMRIGLRQAKYQPIGSHLNIFSL